jgi:hypothetical protein
MTDPAPPPRERTGACLCGRIKYRQVGDSVYDTFCHCIPCRKWTGSVAFTAAICPKEVSKTTRTNILPEHVEKQKQKAPEESQPKYSPTR